VEKDRARDQHDESKERLEGAFSRSPSGFPMAEWGNCKTKIMLALALCYMPCDAEKKWLLHLLTEKTFPSAMSTTAKKRKLARYGPQA